MTGERVAMDHHQEPSILLRRAREGSREALGELFAACGARLLALIRHRLGRTLRARLESADILQMTMMRAFQHIDQFDGDSQDHLMAWLVGIAQNAIRDEADFARRKRRDVSRTMPLSEAVETLPERGTSQIARLILEEETKRLQKAMESLHALQREVIRLRRYEELSFQEIGIRLGKSPDACRMLLARAMTALAHRMRASASSPRVRGST